MSCLHLHSEILIASFSVSFIKTDEKLWCRNFSVSVGLHLIKFSSWFCSSWYSTLSAHFDISVSSCECLTKVILSDIAIILSTCSAIFLNDNISFFVSFAELISAVQTLSNVSTIKSPVFRSLSAIIPFNIFSYPPTPTTIKIIYKKFIFRLYRNWKKEEGAGARSFFVWFVIGLFETLICAIAEDKVCDSCIVSSWALLIFLLCLWWWWPNSNFLCSVITQNGESSRDLLSVNNRKALAPRGTAPQNPPLKH